MQALDREELLSILAEFQMINSRIQSMISEALITKKLLPPEADTSSRATLFMVSKGIDPGDPKFVEWQQLLSFHRFEE